MRTELAALTLVALLAGCSAERSAYLECVCPRDRAQYHQIGFTAPTGEWEFNIHALYHETIRTFAIRLPEKPPEVIRYSHEQLKLAETTAAKDNPLELIGGTININARDRQLLIELHTVKGPFWANGTYPLTVLAF